MHIYISGCGEWAVYRSTAAITIANPHIYAYIFYTLLKPIHAARRSCVGSRRVPLPVCNPISWFRTMKTPCFVKVNEKEKFDEPILAHKHRRAWAVSESRGHSKISRFIWILRWCDGCGLRSWWPGGWLKIVWCLKPPVIWLRCDPWLKIGGKFALSWWVNCEAVTRTSQLPTSEIASSIRRSLFKIWHGALHNDGLVLVTRSEVGIGRASKNFMGRFKIQGGKDLYSPPYKASVNYGISIEVDLWSGLTICPEHLSTRKFGHEEAVGEAVGSGLSESGMAKQLRECDPAGNGAGVGTSWCPKPKHSSPRVQWTWFGFCSVKSRNATHIQSTRSCGCFWECTGSDWTIRSTFLQKFSMMYRWVLQGLDRSTWASSSSGGKRRGPAESNHGEAPDTAVMVSAFATHTTFNTREISGGPFQSLETTRVKIVEKPGDTAPSKLPLKVRRPSPPQLEVVEIEEHPIESALPKAFLGNGQAKKVSPRIVTFDALPKPPRVGPPPHLLWKAAPKSKMGKDFPKI